MNFDLMYWGVLLFKDYVGVSCGNYLYEYVEFQYDIRYGERVSYLIICVLSCFLMKL